MADLEARRPSAMFTLAELPRAVSELGALLPSAPILSLAPRGDGHPVLVLPGLGAGDRSTIVLREYLAGLGYVALPWELGANRGPAMDGLREALTERLDTAYQESDQKKVSLVGWSLGGIYARLLAHLFPDKVRQVITLGSPFAGNPRSTRAYRYFRYVNANRQTDPSMARARFETSPLNDLRLLAGEPIPGIRTTSIFSKSDGVVPWQIAVEPPGEARENIEVISSHIGLGANPAALFAIADRLALGEERWRPFDLTGWRRFVYGAADLTERGMANA